MPEPRRDDRNRHTLQVHQTRARMPGVMQPDAVHLGVVAQFAPEVGQTVRVVRASRLIDDDMT